MYVTVNVTGGQGFLPDEVKDNTVLQQAFAQDIVDRYCGTEYFDPEAVEYYEIPSFGNPPFISEEMCSALSE